MSLESKDQPPAMLWDAKAWLNSESVSVMTWDEQGIYLHLLARSWMNVGIPAELKRIQQLIRLSPSKFKAAWVSIGPNWTGPTDELIEIWAEIDPAWKPPADRLWNPRQEAARLIAFQKREKKQRRSEAGKAAAEARWGTDREAA